MSGDDHATSSGGDPVIMPYGAASIIPWRRHLMGWGLLLCLGIWALPYVIDGPSPLPMNMSVAEGYGWWEGRLDLPTKMHDSAYYQGRYYNVYPPLVPVLAAAVRPAFPNGIPGWTGGLVLVLPVFALGYAVFFRVTGGALWATLLTMAWGFGTPLYPCLVHALTSSGLYFVYHVLSQVGVLLILFEYFGRRRMWPMAIGLVIAAWSRQLMVAYALPILWVAWQQPAMQRGRSLTMFGVTLVVTAAVPMTLNALKFDHPFQSGYSLIDADGLGHPDSRGEWHGLFSHRYVPRNLYYMNVRVPPIGFNKHGQLSYQGDAMGSSLWITTPFLLFFWADIRRLWADPNHRVWLISMGAIVIPLLMYHNTGSYQRGYYRFACDYLGPMMVLIAGGLTGSRRRGIALVLIVASLIYFRAIMTFVVPWSGALSWRY